MGLLQNLAPHRPLSQGYKLISDTFQERCARDQNIIVRRNLLNRASAGCQLIYFPGLYLGLAPLDGLEPPKPRWLNVLFHPIPLNLPCIVSLYFSGLFPLIPMAPAMVSCL